MYFDLWLNYVKIIKILNIYYFKNLMSLTDFRRVQEPIIVELEKSLTPVTSKNVACTLYSDWNSFNGHNIETLNPIHFIHAEEVALQILKEWWRNKVDVILTTWNWKAKKLKHVVPCFNCCKLLEPHTHSGTKVYIWEPEKDDVDFIRVISMDFSELIASYWKRSLSIISQDLPWDDMILKTNLSQWDIALVIDLINFAKKRWIELYLTWWASWRWGATQLLIEKWFLSSYWDIDIIVVNKTSINVMDEFLKIVKNHLGDVTVEYRKIPLLWTTNSYSTVVKLIAMSTWKSIDFSIWNSTVEEVFNKKDYYNNNWYHKLC